MLFQTFITELLALLFFVVLVFFLSKSYINPGLREKLKIFSPLHREQLYEQDMCIKMSDNLSYMCMRSHSRYQCSDKSISATQSNEN